MILQRHPYITGAALFALAFLLRVGAVIETADFPTIQHLVGDAAGYHAWAQRIAGGDWVGDEPFYQAPLYPYVLGSFYSIAGDAVWKARILQAMWGAAAVVLLWLAGGRLFGPAIGFVAALLLSLYGPAVYFDGIVQKASLSNVLVCGLLLAVACQGASPSRLASACTGLVLGLLVLTRENALVWVPILVVYIAWTVFHRNRPAESASTVAASDGDTNVFRRRFAVVQIALLVGGLAVVLAPAAIHNRTVGGEWSLSTFQAGPNFYIGNHSGASGRYDPLVPGHETPEFERTDARRLAQEALGRQLTAREVSQFWMRRAWEEICDDPGAWFALLARKLAITWNRYEVADAESIYVYRHASLILRALNIFNFGLIAPLAIVGILLTWDIRHRLWILYALLAAMTVAVAFFFVLSRYRYPLVPILMLFAGAGAVRIFAYGRAGELRRLVGPIVAGGLAAMAFNVPIHDESRLNAMATMNVGVALAKAGNLPQATHFFATAVEEHPASAEAHNNLAQALALRGAFAAAVPHYRAAAVIKPDLPGVWYNLGVALEQTGRRADALAAYRRALQQDANDAEARAAVRRLEQR